MEQPNTDKEKSGKSPLVKFSEFSFFITPEHIKKWMPFISYMFLLGMIYIANQHYANKAVVKIARLTTEKKELRSEYISIAKELMSKSKQSEVLNRLKDTELKPLSEPPVKIIR
ncbi:MAG: FtsL-like putative cell division protein [Bacteroidota bacterium]|nr:FtsL-like putative cell division protein [Bacteroidota bacterium]